MSEQNIYSVDGEDDAMKIASENARKSFGFFWRELSWEYRRIVPGLDLSIVKVAFRTNDGKSDSPPFEHMWVSDIEFDGETINGVLINEPQWVTSIKTGDPVSVLLSEIGDWMYSISGKVYGAYTVNAMRAKMSKSERKSHDSAWGLDFGEPKDIKVTPYTKVESKSFLSKILGKKESSDLSEHPMSENMAKDIEKALKENPSLATDADEAGWTMLHRESLAGNFVPVSLLTKYGADPMALTNSGFSSIELARKMNWLKIVNFFEER